MRFQCEECGCYEYLDKEGSGEDEIGEFEDYVCKECCHTTRIYEDEDMFSIMYPNAENEEDREEILERNFDKFTS